MALLEKPIARRYARAMIDLAREKNALADVNENLETLANAMDANPELRHALLSPSFSEAQRRAVLSAVLDMVPKVNALTKTFINLLVDKERVAYIPLIAEAFRLEADRLLGRVRAEVQSAAPLGADELEKVKEALKKQATARQLGTEVVVTHSVDPALIAGVRARLGGLVFDGTLKNHLRRIGAQLKEGANAP